jgi:tungstate transport system substrate-binding protein
LVSDGYGENMRPWARNDLVIVGPVSDPAKIRGLQDGALALKTIAAVQAPLVDFQGIGSRELAHNLWKKAGVQPKGDWLLKDESLTGELVIDFARQHGAYVLVGRIPVLSGRMPSGSMEIMVQGDPAMRRSFIVMEANPKKFPQTNKAGARALSDYLLSAKTQEFLRAFGAKQPGGIPLFHPVAFD